MPTSNLSCFTDKAEGPFPLKVRSDGSQIRSKHLTTRYHARSTILDSFVARVVGVAGFSSIIGDLISDLIVLYFLDGLKGTMCAYRTLYTFIDFQLLKLSLKQMEHN